MMESSVVEGEEYYNPEGSEWSQKVDTGQLCRVCANANEYLIPIFDGEGLEHELGMKIQKHLPIEVICMCHFFICLYVHVHTRLSPISYFVGLQ
jgi:hypothetical protein